MRLATIDLGTNTVRLLVAELGPSRAWAPLLQTQRVTRLGEGLTATGMLSDVAVTRTAATVQEYADQARALGASSIRIVATSAVREARNGGDFARALEASTGIPIEIVSGVDEARLTVRGVLDGLGGIGRRLLIFDIGGGSTEFTRVADGRIAATVSLRLGVVPLAERHPFPGPVDPGRYAVMADEIAAQLERELPATVREPGLDALVGTAGTVTTLAALDLGLTHYDAARVQGHRLPRRAVARERARLGRITVQERAALPCLEPGRADLILAGIAIVEATMALVAAETLVVSDRGLREGILAELADTLRRAAPTRLPD